MVRWNAQANCTYYIVGTKVVSKVDGYSIIAPSLSEYSSEIWMSAAITRSSALSSDINDQ